MASYAHKVPRVGDLIIAVHHTTRSECKLLFDARSESSALVREICTDNINLL